MFKIISICIVMLILAFFGVLNPHPVAVSISPGNVQLLPLSTMVTVSVMLGFLLCGILCIPKIAIQKRRIKRLLKNISELQQEFIHSTSDNQEKIELDSSPEDTGRDKETCGREFNCQEVENVRS